MALQVQKLTMVLLQELSVVACDCIHLPETAWKGRFQAARDDIMAAGD